MNITYAIQHRPATGTGKAYVLYIYNGTQRVLAQRFGTKESAVRFATENHPTAKPGKLQTLPKWN